MKNEQELIKYISEGLTEKEIAAKLDCSRLMVKWYVKRLREKHGAINNANLVFKLFEEKINLAV